MSSNTIKIESLIKTIGQEIDWCEKNKDMVSEEYSRGFVKGLEQVIHILKQIQKSELEELQKQEESKMYRLDKKSGDYIFKDKWLEEELDKLSGEGNENKSK